MPDETHDPVMGKTEPSPPDPDYVSRGHQLLSPHARPRRSLLMRILVWLLVLLIFALLFWWVMRRRATKAAATGRHAVGGKVTITTVTATRGDMGVYLNAIGTVTAVHTDVITSQVTGMIVAVHYREGQIVRRGQALIDIDPRPYQAQLMEAEGALERDTNVLGQARMDLARYQAAWAKDAISRQTLEDQQKIVLQYEGTVKVDRGAVQYDKVQVGFCHIVAPIAGRVGLRLVDPGNVVQANSTTPLVVITQVQPITVVFTIPEDSIAQVEAQTRRGRTLPVVALDRGNQAPIASGKLQTLDNQIDTTTGTLKLRALFANKNGGLFPNQFVNTRMRVTTLKGVTLLPTSAIQQNGDTSYVYLIQNNTAKLRNVQTGDVDSGLTVVTGINPGDVVADSSFQKLENNAKVVVSEAPVPANPGGTHAP